MEGAGCEANECGGAAPLAADFEADNVDPCDLTSVEFTSTSTGEIETYSWTFEGGTPATSNEENPVVTYETAGVYDVSLTVYSAVEENTVTMEDYITVHNCTGIGETNRMDLGITPNPNNGLFQMSLPEKANYELKIFDVTGHLVYQSSLTEKINHLDLSHLNNGVYILNADNGVNQIKDRIVIK